MAAAPGVAAAGTAQPSVRSVTTSAARYDFAAQAIERVHDFEEFNAGNDPYDEHDYGAFTLRGREVCWKIDYYDAAMDWGSNDPANPDITTRVLTVMLLEEF
jgi:hypothetical protein